MTTAIESIIQRFREGEMTLDQLADLFASHEFKTPTEDVPEGSPTAYLDLIEKIGTPPEEGTWEELSMASRGLLTEDEYLVILRRRLDRRR